MTPPIVPRKMSAIATATYQPNGRADFFEESFMRHSWPLPERSRSRDQEPVRKS